MQPVGEGRFDLLWKQHPVYGAVIRAFPGDLCRTHALWPRSVVEIMRDGMQSLHTPDQGGNAILPVPLLSTANRSVAFDH